MKKFIMNLIIWNILYFILESIIGMYFEIGIIHLIIYNIIFLIFNLKYIKK